LPKQGRRKPWVFYQNYLRDLRLMRWGSVDDGAMRFERRATRPVVPGAATLDADASSAAATAAP
jgi:hypothetical protein